MADQTIFGVAEQGTYSTNAPNPHIELAGTVASAPAISQIVTDAMAAGQTATINVIKDASNWAVYRGALLTTGAPNILDLSAATLLDSAGTLSDTDSVTVYGLAPGGGAMHTTRAYRTSTWTGAAGWTVLAMNTASWDVGGIWDDTNKRIVPVLPGYYLVSGHWQGSSTATTIYVGVYKNGALEQIMSDIGSYFACGGSALVYCNGTTDYLQFAVYQALARATDVPETYHNYFEAIGPLAL